MLSPLIGLIGAILLIFLAVTFWYAHRSLAPWIPSSPWMITRALDHINASAADTFLDFGCGDGKIVFFVHDRFGMNAVGYEISPLPFLIGKIREFFRRQQGATIHFKNAYTADLKKYSIIYVFGLPETLNEKLYDKLCADVTPGTYVISSYFTFNKKNPVWEYKNKWRAIYIYRF